MEQIIGLVPTKIDQNYRRIIMEFSNGAKALWYHDQECCESVQVEDVCGEWSDLTGTPLLLAEERTQGGETDDGKERWTFYTFRSIRGTVDVRWYGSSNGYYGVAVYFEYAEPGKELDGLERIDSD
jgi:hypothetical protein